MQLTFDVILSLCQVCSLRVRHPHTLQRVPDISSPHLAPSTVATLLVTVSPTLYSTPPYSARCPPPTSSSHLKVALIPILENKSEVQRGETANPKPHGQQVDWHLRSDLRARTLHRRAGCWSPRELGKEASSLPCDSVKSSSPFRCQE